MLIAPFLLLIYGLLALVSSVLPTGSLPAVVSSGFSTIVGYMNVVNGFFPVDTLLSLMVLTLQVDAVLLAVWLVLFVINYARGR